MSRLTVAALKENLLAAQRLMNSEGYASTEGAMGPGENTREVGAMGDRAIAAYRELQDGENSHRPGIHRLLLRRAGRSVLRHPGSAIWIALISLCSPTGTGWIAGP